MKSNLQYFTTIIFFLYCAGSAIVDITDIIVPKWIKESDSIKQDSTRQSVSVCVSGN